MQFFPVSAQGLSLNQAAAAISGSYRNAAASPGASGGSASFADLFGNLNLKEFNPENTPGLPAGFKSVKDDRSAAFKGKDLNFLEKELGDKGVNAGLVQNFMAVLNAQPEIPTVGKIMGLARDLGRKGETLDEQERIAFKGLMQRVGFKAEESNELEQMILDGKGARALERMRQRLTASGAADAKNSVSTALLPDGMLQVTKEEAAALVKSLNLSESAAKHIMDYFGEENELRMNRDGFSKFVAAANAELGKESAELDKLRQAAPQVIRDMLQNSRQEARNEINADNRGSRMQGRTEALLRDTATLLEEDEENKDSPVRRKSIMASILDKSSRIDKAALEKNADAQFEHETSEREFGKESARQFKQFSDNLKGAAGKNSLAAEPGNASTATAARLDATAEAIFSAQPASPSASQSAPAQPTANFADSRAAIYQDKIFDQIQQGIVRNNSNGAHQITMRLDPPDLGRINLTLTVAGNEIKALIRTEQSEVSQVVSEQLAQLKTSLEEQGFKVTELDVETQAQNNPDLDNWTSAEQREQREELEARADFLRLARERAREEANLARNVQSNDHTAINSEAGLHIVA
jgi:flagellar hook-length control protein FliK